MKFFSILALLIAPPMFALYIAHPFVAGLATLWLMSLAVSLLPVPKPTSSQFYRTLFSLAQLVVAELRGFIKLRFPAAPLPPDPAEQLALPAGTATLQLPAPSNLLQMPAPDAPKPPDAA